MSRMAPHNFECPHCGNQQEAPVWDSVNVTLNPELKTSLFNAEINQFVCEKCGEKSFINTPLLYHDMTQGFCVQYYPPDALDDSEFIQRFNSDGPLAMTGTPPLFAESLGYITRPQIVFDMAELVRYVLFRDRINEAKEK